MMPDQVKISTYVSNMMKDAGMDDEDISARVGQLVKKGDLAVCSSVG